jgi:hypothetical protein
MNYLLLIDRAVSVLMGVLNLLGAGEKVSKIIGDRIAAGRTEWTDEERVAITGDLDAARSYAKEQGDLAAEREAGAAGEP